MNSIEKSNLKFDIPSHTEIKISLTLITFRQGTTGYKLNFTNFSVGELPNAYSMLTPFSILFESGKFSYILPYKLVYLSMVKNVLPHLKNIEHAQKT